MHKHNSRNKMKAINNNKKEDERRTEKRNNYKLF